MLWIVRTFCHLCGRIEWCNFQNRLISQFVLKVFEFLKCGFSACRTSYLSALVFSLCVFPRISSGVGGASSCGSSMALLMLFTSLIIFQRASSRYFPLSHPDLGGRGISSSFLTWLWMVWIKRNSKISGINSTFLKMESGGNSSDSCKKINQMLFFFRRGNYVSNYCPFISYWVPYFSVFF